ncbi:cytochrome c oxidase accessory protein CcoG [Solitalea koreensis]|uniref:Cytochrome c oxidase accessory protein FixG n=1 Tax=Solitalea koreensis TaxID=543615 RepID=A0A521BEW4_9SPHI|nr:cytochrome c oxidase accessory protein CcoG [Solitalea koreensis]SMO45638.1 cytochrome c oxidase accessory protein FixG [Solitalea koreensis]
MTEHNHDRSEEFRDHIATVDEKGKRNWIYAQQPVGKYYNIRTILSVFYLLIFFLLPFIRINGKALFLFNILERRFTLFGVTFWPQDFFILGVAMLTFIVFIVFFTLVFGRVFCGWACPQTIFMEMVFRRIEYWIEGNQHQQRALNNGPLTNTKIIKKSSKHLIFFTISFLIANTFLAYIIGIENLFKIIKEPIGNHLSGFISLIIFSFIFYGVFAFMREQICVSICPYGRLQGVLLDKDSIVVAYDRIRGEKRGKFKKNEIRTLGDCIDCDQCVKVCPTGIDIRNGTQLECVNCTACIDACDFMMTSVGLPTGLIRLASENTIAKSEKYKFTGKLIGYSAILTILLCFMSFLFISRKDVQSTITRVGGMLYQEQADNRVSNLYNIKVYNKTSSEVPIEIRLENKNAEVKLIGKALNAKKEGITEGTFFIYLPKEIIKNRSTKLNVTLWSEGKKLETIKTSFLGPVSR